MGLSAHMQRSSIILNHVYALYCTLENVRLHSIHQYIYNAYHMSSHPLRPGSLQHHHTSSLGGCTDGMSGTQTGSQHRSTPGEVQLQGRVYWPYSIMIEYNSTVQYHITTLCVCVTCTLNFKLILPGAQNLPSAGHWEEL